MTFLLLFGAWNNICYQVPENVTTINTYAERSTKKSESVQVRNTKKKLNKKYMYWIYVCGKLSQNHVADFWAIERNACDKSIPVHSLFPQRYPVPIDQKQWQPNHFWAFRISLFSFYFYTPFCISGFFFSFFLLLIGIKVYPNGTAADIWLFKWPHQPTATSGHGGG